MMTLLDKKQMLLLKREGLLAEISMIEAELDLKPEKKRVLVVFVSQREEILTDLRNTAYNQNVEEGDGNPVGS